MLRPLYRGTGDPTMRIARESVARATWMASGAATVSMRVVAGAAEATIEAEAWGPGADEALDRVPALLGLDDDDSGFDPSLHPQVASLARARPGLRLARTGSVLEA